MDAGRAYIETIQRFHSLNVVLSWETVCRIRDLTATVRPMKVKTAEVKNEELQYHGQNMHQNAVGIAIVHLAGISPITRGAVLRPMALSPAWSYISWVWTVVKTIAPITASHLVISLFKDIVRPPRATSRGAEIWQTKPHAFKKFRMMQFPLAPLAPLYHAPSSMSAMHCLSPPILKLTMTAIG